MSIDWSESSLCPSTQTSKFTLFFFVIYKKIQDKCAHGLASHDASGEKPGENCFADRVTLGYRRAIAFEKMLLPRAAFEKKLLAGTLSLISKVTAASTATLRQSGCPEEEMMMFIIVLTKN